MWPKSCLPDVQKILIVAKGIWDRADANSTSQIKGQLNKAEFIEFLQQFWAYSKSEFSWDGSTLDTPDMPSRVWNRVKRFDEYLFFVEWSEMLEVIMCIQLCVCPQSLRVWVYQMLCQPPWKLLIPPALRTNLSQLIQSDGSEAWRNCIWAQRQSAGLAPEVPNRPDNTCNNRVASSSHPPATSSIGHTLQSQGVEREHQLYQSSALSVEVMHQLWALC